MNNQVEKAILEKLKALTPERITEVEDFVDFLRTRDDERKLTQAAGKLAEGSLRKVWGNPEDADYDRL